MNTTKLSTIAALLFFGANTAGAETTPAWMEQGFIMEEVVVTAEAPAHLYMEEIVVTAQAPAHLYMEEIVVTAEASVYAEEVAAAASRTERREWLQVMRSALLPAATVGPAAAEGWREWLQTLRPALSDHR